MMSGGGDAGLMAGAATTCRMARASSTAMGSCGSSSATHRHVCFFCKVKTVDCLFHFSAFLLRPGEGLIGKTAARASQADRHAGADQHGHEDHRSSSRSWPAN